MYKGCWFFGCSTGSYTKTKPASVSEKIGNLTPPSAGLKKNATLDVQHIKTPLSMHRLQISALPLAVTNCQISSIFQLFSLSTHCYGSLQSFSTSLLAFWVDCPGGNRGRGKAVACRQVSRCRLCRFQEEKDRKTDGAGPSHQVSCGIKQIVRLPPSVNKMST